MESNTNCGPTSQAAILRDILKRKILSNSTSSSSSTKVEGVNIIAPPSQKEKSKVPPLLPLPPPKLNEDTIALHNVQSKKETVPPEPLPVPPETQRKQVEDLSRNLQQILADGFAEKNKEMETLRSLIATMKQERDAYRLRARKKFDVVLSKNSELCFTIKTGEIEFQALYEILTEVFSEKNKTDRENGKLVSEKDDLIQTIGELKKAKLVDNPSLSLKIKEVSEQNEKFSVEIKDLKRQLENVTSEKQELELFLNEKCNDFNQVRKKYDEFEEWLAVHFEQLRVVVKEKNDEVAKLERKCESLSHLLSVEIARYQKDTGEFGNKIKKLEADAKVGKEAHEKILRELTLVRNEKAEMQGILEVEREAHEKMKSELLSVCIEKAEMQSVLEVEKEANEKVRSELLLVRNEKAELQSVLKVEAEAAERDRQNYQERIAEIKSKKDKEIAKLQKKQNIELQQFADEMNGMRNQLEELMTPKLPLKIKVVKNSGTRTGPTEGEKDIPDDVVEDSSKTTSEDIEVPTESEPYSKTRRSSRLKRKVTDDEDQGTANVCEQANTEEEEAVVQTKKSRGSVPEPGTEEATGSTTPVSIEVITLSDSED